MEFMAFPFFLVGKIRTSVSIGQGRMFHLLKRDPSEVLQENSGGGG